MQNNITLSVCLIVRDEEEVISRCLDCVKEFADEIIAVDTGSTDKTVEKIRKYTDKVWFYKWRDDFSAARNFAFEKAICDYVLWIDADDIVTKENIEKINGLKKAIFGYDMVFMYYAAGFDGDEPTFVYERERIFKRDKNYRFSGFVHEAVQPAGRIFHSDACIYHKKVKRGDPLRNLQIIQRQISSGVKLDSRLKFYYGRELLSNNMPQEGIAVLEDYLKGDGWAVNKRQACLDLYRAYLGLNDLKNAEASLLKSLLYLVPNAEVCCLIGGMFFDKEEYKSAAYWYESALTVEDTSGDFINSDYRRFIPYIQLCAIYYRLGDIKKAYNYNLLAGTVKPQNENYLYNKKFFKSLGIRGAFND